MTSEQPKYNHDTETSELTIHVLLFISVCVTVLLVLGVGIRYYLKQDFSLIHATLSVFFSLNLLICWWECCLFLQRTRVEARTVYWREWGIETGKLPYIEFFSSKIPLRKVFSPKIWADVWATYSQYDSSYADRRSYGFNIDIANGLFTWLPTLLLYAAITIYFLPAYIVGMIGLMLCWQWVYATTVYLVSFFVAKRQHHISNGDVYLYIFGPSIPWFLFPLLGLFVSIRLIVDGNYSVLG